MNHEFGWTDKELVCADFSFNTSELVKANHLNHSCINKNVLCVCVFFYVVYVHAGLFLAYTHESETVTQNVSEEVYWFQICFVLLSCISILYLKCYKSEYQLLSCTCLSRSLLFLWTWLKSSEFSIKKDTNKHTFHTWNMKFNRSVVEHPLLFTYFEKLHFHASVSGLI